MHELLMADNTIVTVSMAGVGRQGGLWIHVHNHTLLECAAIFGNPQKTSQMHIEFDKNMVNDFEGFTNLVSLSMCDDFVIVGLEKDNA